MVIPKVCFGRNALISGRRTCRKTCRAFQAIADGSESGSRLSTATQAQPQPEFKNIGVGFSAGGLLFPYHIGAADALVEAGLLTSES